MVDVRFSDEEKKMLKKMKGSVLCSVKSTACDDWGRIHGNVVLKTTSGAYEIKNAVESVKFFDGIEDVSVFHVHEISDKHPYKPMILGVPITETPIGQKIENIIVVEDSVSVSDDKGGQLHAAVFVTAVVFMTEGDCFVLSREWYFGEEILFAKTDNPMKAVYPVEKIEEDWTDEESNTIVKCRRKETRI